ncbi:MAG: mechanosensitive ion channel family protein [Methanomicrobiales archaeon]
MLREIAIFSLLCALAGISYALSYNLQIPILNKIATSLATIAGSYLLFKIVLDTFVSKQIRDPKAKYSVRKVTSILFAVTLVGIAILIWIEDTQVLFVSYGLIAAGLAIALQDVVKNFVGGIILFSTAMYRVGDRIEIDNRFGDVMDIGLMNTTMLETRAWVAGDQPTGRIVMIPNGRILSTEIVNYTKDHSFIWEELVLPLTYTSNWKRAISLIMEILTEVTAGTTARATEQIERLNEKYYLPRKVVEPSIYLTPTDNWIELHIRYVTDVRERRAIHNQISKRLLDEVLSKPDIVVASATMEISGRHEVHLTGSDRP